ncbi:hypothetical protein BDZ94DRAFT_1170083 [Collybia nuda]|uniref:Uncharacterized protein n=1 Tax=Collybia nuda TaxID=64659 RepID=A0A9P5Y0U2_9AGAR|nr:hypothetical protein BDZ94DRAFT_1170083 [Collybia nuda]
MSDPRPDNIILRCSTKNRKGEWVWADIFPEGWKMSLEVNRTEVGVFERRNELQSPENRFIHGAVAFTVGSKTAEGTQITWTEPHRRSCARPKSFSHAVDILNKTTQSATAIYWLPDDHHLKDKNRIRFYTFPEDNLCTWKAIPLEAHRDDVIWRTLVPEPGKILGVMAE